jgi:acyl carrier protein
VSSFHPEIHQLRSWILENNPAIQSIGDDDELIDSRVLNSFAFLQFVYYIEEVFGQEVVLDEKSVGNFRSLASVCRHFKANQEGETQHA